MPEDNIRLVEIAINGERHVGAQVELEGETDLEYWDDGTGVPRAESLDTKRISIRGIFAEAFVQKEREVFTIGEPVSWSLIVHRPYWVTIYAFQGRIAGGRLEEFAPGRYHVDVPITVTRQSEVNHMSKLRWNRVIKGG